LSSAVDSDTAFSPIQALSPVISYPNETVRNEFGLDIPSNLIEPETMEKEKKRNRRVSLVGKLGVREILVGLKWTKEKAKQRMKQSTQSAQSTQPTAVPPPPPPSDHRMSIDLASDTRGSIDDSQEQLKTPVDQHTSENVGAAPTSQASDPPTPYKRNRRRSLASIFKFGNSSAVEDKSVSRSRSRVDLVAASGDESSSRYGGSRADDSGTADADSDWDRMSSPSDVPGRSKSMKKMHSFSQESSASGTSRGRAAPVNIPAVIPVPGGGSRSRRGSGTVARTASMTRQIYNSASASAASLISSSVFGSSTSQHSLHESFGGRRAMDAAADAYEDDRKRLKKPVKSPRRPPSVSGRRSRPPSIQGSTSGRLDQSQYPTRSRSSTLNGPGHGRSPGLNGISSINSSNGSTTDLSQPKLALTPANIVPLLVYAREVKLKLADCLIEIKNLETDLLLASGLPDERDRNGEVEIEIPGAHW
jgi:hypothetical protein